MELIGIYLDPLFFSSPGVSYLRRILCAQYIYMINKIHGMGVKLSLHIACRTYVQPEFYALLAGVVASWLVPFRY
jgi:hypothetical protein